MGCLITSVENYKTRKMSTYWRYRLWQVWNTTAVLCYSLIKTGFLWWCSVMLGCGYCSVKAIIIQQSLAACCQDFVPKLLIKFLYKQGLGQWSNVVIFLQIVKLSSENPSGDPFIWMTKKLCQGKWILSSDLENCTFQTT